MNLMIQSWCPGGKCDPCKPTSTVPPQLNGQPWPPAGSAVEMVVYAMQDHLTNGKPDGGSVLDGIGGQYITPHGVGPFSWNWGPTPIEGGGYGGMYFVTFLNFFDGAGLRPIGSADMPSEQARYTTIEDANATAQQFQTYFYG